MRRLANSTALLTLPCVCALLITATPQIASAQGARAMAALNIEGEGLDVNTVETLSSVVRNEAQQIADYQVVNSSPINLSEVVLVLGCDVSSIACLEEASRQLDARILIYGSVRQEGANYRLKLEVFDADRRQVTHTMQKVIAKSDDLVVVSRQEIGRFFRQLRQEQLAATLIITSNVRGATVALNGEPIGITPLERAGLAPGTYTIQVSMDGFTSWNAEIELGERAQMRMRAPLQKIAPQESNTGAKQNASQGVIISPEQKPDLRQGVELPSQRSGTNWGAVSMMSVGGVALVASGATAWRMKRLEDDLQRRFDEGNLTPEERQRDVERGYSLQFTHRVLLGLGAACVVVGGVWWLADDGQPGPNKRRAQIGLSPTGVVGTVTW